jgi:hypothetical protein
MVSSVCYVDAWREGREGEGLVGLVRRRRRAGERWWCAGFLISRSRGWL